jgi:hypothetical protein
MILHFRKFLLVMQNGIENKEMNIKKRFLGIVPLLIVIVVTTMVSIDVSVK